MYKNKNNNYEVTLKNYTRWDEELGSYILTEEGKKLTERDMINIIGNMEHGNRETIVSVLDILEPESNEQTMQYPMCGWKYKEDNKNIKHTCGRCKYEYVSPDCYPCNACVVYGRTNPREDLCEEKEDEQ